MAPREASDSPGAVATSALRGLQALARLAPLVTKDRWASQEPPGPQASQVRPEVLGCCPRAPGAWAQPGAGVGLQIRQLRSWKWSDLPKGTCLIFVGIGVILLFN